MAMRRETGVQDDLVATWAESLSIFPRQALRGPPLRDGHLRA